MIKNRFVSIVLRSFLLLGASTLSPAFLAEAEPGDEAAAVDADAVEEARLRVAAHEAVEAAIPLAEKDPTRPVYHFRPPAQWMNDICGAIFYKGYYHVFYQYNPHSGDSWGSRYTLWAHTRSKDLVHWEDLPWSFLPMKERGELRCNSGCVALDDNGKPIIFYTFVPRERTVTQLGKREQWAVVPLDDELIKWKRVSGPVMAAGMNGIPESVPSGWSDPFVFRSEGRTFVTFKSCNGLVCEATNQTLTQWKYVGKIDNVSGECPNFFPLQDKWVLLRSSKSKTQNGEVFYMSYLVGDFDAKTIAFKNTTEGKPFDLGFGNNPPKDRSWTRGLYATNTFKDDNGRRVMVGWVCGFKPQRGWNGCMSLPRVLTLDEDQQLIQTPVPELQKLRGDALTVKETTVSDASQFISGAQGDTIEIVAVFQAGDAKAFGLKLRCDDDGKDAVVIRHDGEKLNVGGTDVPVALAGENKELKLHIFLDKSVMEVFVDDGRLTVTRVVYPGEKDLKTAIFAEGGSATLKTMTVWTIKGVWDRTRNDEE